MENEYEKLTLKDKYNMLLNITSIEDPESILKVFSNKWLTGYSKALYSFIFIKGGAYKYQTYLQLTEKLGCSVTILVKSIKELQENNLLKVNQKEKILIIK